MNKLSILPFLFLGCASLVWADVPLMYEGFDYADGTPLAPKGDAVPAEGVQNPNTGKYWYSAGTSNTRPIAITGNVYIAGYDASGLPLPTGNSAYLTTNGANGTSVRQEIPYPATAPLEK